jgi:hypothetical protein
MSVINTAGAAGWCLVLLLLLLLLLDKHLQSTQFPAELDCFHVQAGLLQQQCSRVLPLLQVVTAAVCVLRLKCQQGGVAR